MITVIEWILLNLYPSYHKWKTYETWVLIYFNLKYNALVDVL